MKIQIHSFASIQKMAKTPFPPHTALISIGDVGSDPPLLQNKPEFYLRLAFDDIDVSWLEGEYGYRYVFRLFTGAQAEEIVRFLSERQKEIELLICQCHCGRSRSTAVAAAVRQYYDGDGIQYFMDKSYHPNIFVFSCLMEAFERQKKIELDDKGLKEEDKFETKAQ